MSHFPGLLYGSCFLEFQRLLRVTSPLLIVLEDRKGCHWVLTILPFVWGVWPHHIQWKWGNVGIFYKLLRIGVFPIIPPLLGPGLPPSHLLYRGFLPSSCLIKARDDLWYIGDAYHHLVWWVRLFRYLSSENNSHTRPDKNVSSPYHTSRSNPEAGNSCESTCSLGAQARRRVQRFLTRAHICYLCFWSTLASILSKFNLFSLL